jgi:hypothetical protein
MEVLGVFQPVRFTSKAVAIQSELLRIFAICGLIIIAEKR